VSLWSLFCLMMVTTTTIRHDKPFLVFCVGFSGRRVYGTGMSDDRHPPTIRREGRTKVQGDIASNLSEHWVITDFMVDGVLLSLLTFFLYSYYSKTPTAISALFSLHGILFYIHICFEYFVQASVGRSFLYLNVTKSSLFPLLSFCCPTFHHSLFIFSMPITLHIWS